MEQNQLKVISSKIITRILSVERTNNNPILIAIDGGSGSGKSSIAGIIAKQLNATLIATDDFYAAEITHEVIPFKSKYFQTYFICLNLADSKPAFASV